MKRLMIWFCFVLILLTLTTPALAVSKSGKPLVAPKPATSSMPDKKVATDAAVTPTPAASDENTYALPYPGILPDHPLYFMKRFRDAVLDALIVDPIRKAEFYVLQGDKRLSMGMALFDQKKAVLAEQVISRAEKYMVQAVDALKQSKDAKREIPGYVIDRLERSLAKHSDVITSLSAKASESEKTGLAGSLKLVTELQERLAKIQ